MTQDPQKSARVRRSKARQILNYPDRMEMQASIKNLEAEGSSTFDNIKFN